jgi:hypothetical protein
MASWGFFVVDASPLPDTVPAPRARQQVLSLLHALVTGPPARDNEAERLFRANRQHIAHDEVGEVVRHPLHLPTRNDTCSPAAAGEKAYVEKP